MVSSSCLMSESESERKRAIVTFYNENSLLFSMLGHTNVQASLQLVHVTCMHQGLKYLWHNVQLKERNVQGHPTTLLDLLGVDVIIDTQYYWKRLASWNAHRDFPKHIILRDWINITIGWYVLMCPKAHHHRHPHTRPTRPLGACIVNYKPIRRT